MGSGVGAVPSCLVPGPKVIRAGDTGPDYESHRGSGGDVGSGLVSLSLSLGIS